jgi:hypothetical protein
VLCLGCGKSDTSSEPKGNPITTSKGPTGAGGDPAAMATLRAPQQLRTVNAFRQIAQYYELYRAESGRPTTEGFKKYLEAQARDAAQVAEAVKNGDYVIVVSPADSKLLAYEKDKDYQNTRVVLKDGAVTKTMPEAEFQEALKKAQ